MRAVKGGNGKVGLPARTAPGPRVPLVAGREVGPGLFDRVGIRFGEDSDRTGN